MTMPNEMDQARIEEMILCVRFIFDELIVSVKPNSMHSSFLSSFGCQRQRQSRQYFLVGTIFFFRSAYKSICTPFLNNILFYFASLPRMAFANIWRHCNSTKCVFCQHVVVVVAIVACIVFCRNKMYAFETCSMHIFLVAKFQFEEQENAKRTFTNAKNNKIISKQNRLKIERKIRSKMVEQKRKMLPGATEKIVPIEWQRPKPIQLFKRETIHFETKCRYLGQRRKLQWQHWNFDSRLQSISSFASLHASVCKMLFVLSNALVATSNEKLWRRRCAHKFND